MLDNLSMRCPIPASRDDISDIRGGITQWDSALFITDIQVISKWLIYVKEGTVSLDYASGPPV